MTRPHNPLLECKGQDIDEQWALALYKSRFIWEGLPSFNSQIDANDAIEKVFYEGGYAGLFEADGLVFIGRAIPKVWDIYGDPSDAQLGVVGSGSGVNLISTCLCVSKRMIYSEDVKEELEIIHKMRKTLRKNVIQLGFPYIVYGDVGQELRLMDTKTALESEDWIVPSMGRITVEQLDLRIPDLTPSMAVGIDAAKARVCDTFGIESIGVTKASGVTQYEAAAGSLTDNLILEQEYVKRLEFAAMCTAILGHPVTVELSPTIEVKLMQPQQQNAPPEESTNDNSQNDS